jgi:hypothetical protein
MPNQVTAKDKLDDWDKAIDLGIEYRKKYGYSDSWQTYKNYYRGEFPTATGTKLLPYNITYSMARTLIPNLYFRNPYVTLSPRFKMGTQLRMDVHAKIVEAVDNWLLQEMSVKREMKTGALDSFFCNRAIWKIGYDSQFGFVPSKTEGKLGMSDTTFTSFDKKGNLNEYNINVKPGMPWVLRINPEDFIVPFGVRTLDESPWAAHRVIRPLEDVKGDSKYKNTKELTGTHLEKIYKDTKRADFYKQMEKICDWVEIWEVRDRKKKEIFAFVPGYPEYLREPEEDLLQIEGLPFVDLCLNEDTDYYWGSSDCKIFEPQQLECNEARTQAMLHRRIALVKFLVDKNVMSQDEIDKMLSENVGPAVRVNGPPATAVTMITPHIPPDLVQWVDKIRDDVRELVGFSRQDSGELPSGRRTKYEVGVAQMGKEIRIDERRDMMAESLTDIIRKVNQVIFDRWDSQHVIQVVGYDGARYWVQYTKDAIVGEYNIKVDVESMTPMTKSMKRQELVQLIGSLAKYPRANLDYLMKMLVREFDYLDALQVLPEAPEMAGGQPMTAQQYGQHQNQLLNDPTMLQNRVARTQGLMGAGE